LKKKQEIQKKNARETKRLTRLEMLRKASQEEQDSIENDLKDTEIHYLKLENELNLLNKQKSQAESALSQAATEASVKASEARLSFTLEKIEKLEEEQFVLLENKEDYELKRKEAQECLKGSLETYEEINVEVKEVVQKEQEAITNLLKRIKLLKEELHESFKIKLESILKKNLKISPFTRLEGRACEFCKLELSRLDEENIEKNFQLKSCSGCGRLFIPKEA